MIDGLLRGRMEADGIQISATRLPVGIGFRLVSPNLCDDRSWWQGSIHAPDQPTTDSGDHLTYALQTPSVVIDLRHGRMTLEDNVGPASVSPVTGLAQTDLIPTVKLDGVALAQSCEGHASHADRYTIAYATGAVTFGVARDPAVVVTLSCRRKGSSIWQLKPSAGTILHVEDVEIDCTEDLDMIVPVVVRAYGSHPVLTAGFIVPIFGMAFKSFHDFQAIAREFFGPIPANMGGSGGCPSPKWTFKWMYGRADVLYPGACDFSTIVLGLDPLTTDWGAFTVPQLKAQITVNYMEVELLGDVPYGGSYLTFTMYGAEDPMETA